MTRQPDISGRISRAQSTLDQYLGTAFPVLDHGFVRVVDYMGNDDAIVQAARVSYGTGTKAVQDDRGLIRYLMRHWHSTPFEMCEVKFHVKLPVFVARQWIRHRTANVNEYSARYSILDREFYIPEVEHLAVQSTDNKQGRAEVLSPEQAVEIQTWLVREANQAYDGYLDVIKPVEDGGHYGLARELARMNLPTNIYTQWYWKVDLHNLFHFLRLRADPHAQFEIRVYADAICKLVKEWVPHAYEAFEDYRLHAQQFSGQEMEVLRALLNELEDLATSAGLLKYRDFFNKGLSKRETADFLKKIEVSV